MNRTLSEKPGLLWGLAMLLALAVGVWLRMSQLGHQILLDDEWHAVHKLMQADYRGIFLSFGYADHSIPLTLLFNLLAETIGLSELRMRALPLLFGLLSLLVVPWLLKPWLDRRAVLLLTALLALSPLLIHFSRYVRPYSITILLGFAAVIALWHWWHDEDRRWLLVFVPATILAAWLHPLTLLFTGGALSWFGLIALARWWRERDPSSLLRLIPVGLASAIPTALLILPPLLTNPVAMTAKTGVHSLRVETAFRAWELITGTASWWVAGPLLIFALIGAVLLFRKDRHFLLYWLYLISVSLVTIALLSPAWVHHALVPVRYLSVAMPMVLALIALGMVGTFDGLGRAWNESLRFRVATAGTIVIIGALVVTGPLPRIYGQFNQFTNSLNYQFDYDVERNPFVRASELVPMPEFYHRLAAEPGDWLLIEGPWHFEAHFTPLWNWQRQHGMELRIGMVSGLCAPWTPGELRAVEGKRFRFSQFVPLANLPWALADYNRFIVFHRKPPMTWEIRELPPLEECYQILLDRLGEPWYEDDRRSVFRLEAGARISPDSGPDVAEPHN